MEKICKMLYPKISIYWMWSYTPRLRLTSDEVEEKIRSESEYTDFQDNIVFELSGTHSRFFADSTEQASDLAVNASKEALIDALMSIDDIDCILFASASQDMIEPATANKIQQILWSHAPVFDIKNACNSFLNGLQVAKSLIISWQYTKILVCSWETSSRAIRWSTWDRAEFREALAWYNLGDAWVAMILGKKKPKNPEILFTEFLTRGSYHDASTIAGGGSCFPRDIEKLYFRSDSKKLSEAFSEGIWDFTKKVLKKNNWNLSDIDYFIPHIVSRYSSEVFSQIFAVPHHKILNHNNTHGNMASCSVPFSFITANKQKKFIPWDRILIVWLWAGASFGLVGIEFQ